jgi:iron(III) transport system substrate-binding protein
MAHRQGRDRGQPRAQGHDRGKPFKSETIPISAVGANMVKVQQMLDRVGFQ